MQGTIEWARKVIESVVNVVEDGEVGKIEWRRVMRGRWWWMSLRHVWARASERKGLGRHGSINDS